MDRGTNVETGFINDVELQYERREVFDDGLK
jgi:hypothetical protein